MSRFSSRALSAVAALAVVLVLVPMMMAQPPEGGRRGGRGRGGFGFGGPGGGFAASGLQLAARVKEVQEALKLTEEQIDKVTDISDELRKETRKLIEENEGDFRARPQEREKLFDAANAKLAEVLDEGQQKRLMGIQIQVVGAASLFDKAIAEELGVTADQRSQLREVQRGIGEAMQDAMAELRDKDLSREEIAAELGKVRDENDKKLLAVLTEDQQDQYEELQGEKVEIDMSQLRGRGGFGGRGGQDGRGRRGGRNRDNDGDNANAERGV